MGRLFGTDGARGVAVTELTCELAMQIGRCAAMVLTKKTHRKPTILIGKDTRISGDILEAALVAGICSTGADVRLLGVVPTPAVAYLVKKYAADAGVMISASHNSFEFNGIKLFASNGYKLSDDMELEIEELVLDRPQDIAVSKDAALGRVHYETDAVSDYVKHVSRSISGDLSGVRVAIDCANGSASATAEKLFSGLGATCYLLNVSPDGVNINDRCGSTYMDTISKFVCENNCHVGVAFDGDADRCLAVDENGKIVDGDKLIAIFAKAMKKQKKLKNDTAVVTVLTNIGFSRFAEAEDIKMLTTKVGDRYILEQMLIGGYNLGGEQSGHIIFLDEATTGDGQLSAVKLLGILASSKQKMSELASVMERYPQVMINVKIASRWKELWKNDDEIEAVIEKYTKLLGAEGRILVRESGTEPLIRVMLEGRQFAQINEYAVAIADVIRSRCPAEA